MGYHYVPKAYLRGFCVEGSDTQIEVFDQKQQRHFRSNVDNVAQEKGYYDEETEHQLATLIEDPAKPAIDLLREGRDIGDDDRLNLAVYAAVLLRRVPRSRERRRKQFPETVREAVGNVRSQLLDYLARGEGEAAVIRKRLEEIEGLEERLIESPPEKVLEQMKSPWPSRAVVEAILTMNWRIVDTDGPQYFITTDNPGFFFSSYGLATPKSEFVLPLSSTVALAGYRSLQAAPLKFLGTIRQALVREINRRLLSEATRFIFSSRRESWIPKVAAKKKPYLSRIRWR